MKRQELIGAVGNLIESDLVFKLKLVRESSYGVLSNKAIEEEKKQFKSQKLKGVLGLTDSEINVLMDYILLKNGLIANEKEINKLYGYDER